MKIFLSHASEDKRDFVCDLAQALTAQNLDVWFDEYTLRPGDSLRESIERGLSEADYGVVVLSEAFFAGRWPKQELNGLFVRDISDERRFLIPIWHKIGEERVRQLAPMLADRIALKSEAGIGRVTAQILAVLVGDERRRRWSGATIRRHRYAHRYYNPPSEIPCLGYELKPGGFADLVEQLRPREILVAHGSPYGTHKCAAHVTDEERMLEIERDWQEAPCYFAVDVRKLRQGFDDQMPADELMALVRDPAQHGDAAGRARRVR